jgi:hypothetical protein
MKKLIFALAVLFSLSFAACNGTTTYSLSSDSVDSVDSVDSIDTVVVDSVVVDTVA